MGPYIQDPFTTMGAKFKIKFGMFFFFLVCNISAHFKSNITYTFLLIASTSTIIMVSAKCPCGALGTHVLARLDSVFISAPSPLEQGYLPEGQSLTNDTLVLRSGQ